MRCPTCVDEGERSFVHEGGTTTTLMMYNSYYDEDGDHHFHDPNTRTTSYSCSRGHRWSESYTPSCATCERKAVTEA